MIIKKRSIKSADEVADLGLSTEAVVEVPGEAVLGDPVAEVAVVTESTGCPYEKAITCIRNAIDALGAVAKDDALARESIANLSVVLFDLKC